MFLNAFSSISHSKLVSLLNTDTNLPPILQHAEFVVQPHSYGQAPLEWLLPQSPRRRGVACSPCMKLIYEFVIQCAATTRSPVSRASKLKKSAAISTLVTWTLIWLVSGTYIGSITMSTIHLNYWDLQQPSHPKLHANLNQCPS